MIFVPTAIWSHDLLDVAAWAGAAVTARWQHRRWPAAAQQLARQTTAGYFITLAVSGLAGAWLIGSLNLSTSGGFVASHSIAGAIAGGIVGVELWKWRHGVRQSTGGAFVAPLCTGIAIGRLGCLFAGLPDRTFGTATALPWAVDLGDGIGRHPVQLYEALTMIAFLIVYLGARSSGKHWAREKAFSAFVVVYAVQRFAWEFLKPYPTVAGPLNVFHLLMLGLLVYGIVWWRRGGRAGVTAL